MYIDYSKLWKLLAEKGLSKTDLMQLTGLSSRIIAKLNKNATVTTDTIARICAALSCGVGDVMECADENDASFYSAFRTCGRVIEENENIRKIGFSFKDQEFVVYITKNAASKSTHIICESDGTVYWKQYYPVGRGFGTNLIPANTKTPLVKPARASGEIAAVVIKGRPSLIAGLDEGIWVSAERGKAKTPKDVFVMTEAQFKLFVPEL